MLFSFCFLPWRFRASRTGLKTGHYKEDLTARKARHRRFRAAACLQQAGRRYEIIIYWSQADEAFIAKVPELPGCAADGKTYKETLANVEIIIHEWIETAKELGREPLLLLLSFQLNAGHPRVSCSR